MAYFYTPTMAASILYQNSLSNISRPSFHYPYPDAALICPALPILISSLPQFSANNLALSNETQGSLILATTIVGKSIATYGIGSKPFAGKVYCGASISLGATNKAPFTFLLYCFAQCVIAAQPGL